MPDPKGLPPLIGAAAEQQMQRLTRRGFVVGAGAALAGFGAWRWLTSATSERGIPWPLRRMLGFNQGLAESLGAPNQLATTFPAESVKGSGRTNGRIGLFGDVDGASWELLVQHEGRGPAQTI